MAAFFDLDKTILAKSSSLAFARPLYRGGLIGRADVLRSAYAQMVYLASGADHDQMEKMRHYMSELCAGWDVSKVRSIIQETLDDIVDPIVYSEAMSLIEEHHEAGHDVIIISSSGTEVVEPVAARLGADKAIGTQLAIDNDVYTGEILFYAYGPNKADAMHQLAEDEGYDLASCFAYTDSHTDLPMLEVVGHPFAVNPDEELRRISEERDWPILDFERPASMQGRLTRDQKRAAAAGVSAVALGAAWYTRYRKVR